MTADPNAARRRWMAVLARASAVELEDRLAGLPPPPRHLRLRGPETGLVMVCAAAPAATARPSTSAR